MKDQTQAERNRASSPRNLIFNNYYTKSINEQQLNRQQTSIENTNDDSQTTQTNFESSLLQQSLADRPTFCGPFGIITASTILWYACICILFIIAFLALVLSILYFLIDSSTERIIKLYGITGSGSLAIVTIVVTFLDCYNDDDREDFEEETIYRILRIKETEDKELALRGKHPVAKGKEEKPKLFTIQHQRPPLVPVTVHSHPQPPLSYHHPLTCRVCHDLHAPKNHRYNVNDVSVDTSDKFEPVSKRKTTTPKLTCDAQTESAVWDAERGTQTDRTEGTQTSTMELNGIPNNATEIIHETTIFKAPRRLLSTLKKSMKQQDKDISITGIVLSTQSMTVSDV